MSSERAFYLGNQTCLVFQMRTVRTIEILTFWGDHTVNDHWTSNISEPAKWSHEGLAGDQHVNTVWCRCIEYFVNRRSKSKYSSLTAVPQQRSWGSSVRAACGCVTEKVCRGMKYELPMTKNLCKTDVDTNNRARFRPRRERQGS